MTTKLSVLIALVSITAARAQPAPPVPEPAPAPEPPPEPPAPEPPVSVPPPVAVAPPDQPHVAASGEVHAKPAAKDGFIIRNADGSWLKIGGFVQFDARLFVDDSADPHVDQFAFRSIRPDLQGTVYDHYDFRLFPDFAGGKLVVQDAYLDVHYLDAFEVRVGKFKVPFGLERLQAETATTFIDRGLPTQVAPNRDLGVEIFGDLEHGTFAYQLGVFNGVADGASGDGDVSDDKEVAARVFVRPFATGAAIVKDLGFGAAVTYGDKLGTPTQPDVGTFKTQAQDTFFSYKLGTTLMDTVAADGRHWRATAQGYWYTGPLGLLAEYVRSNERVVLNGTHISPTIDSWQVLAQWVVTGGDATYKSVAPAHPFDPAAGQLGAIDVAARIGELRFTDGTVFDQGFADPTRSSRRAWSAGAGVDWFANKAVRFVLDVEHTWFTLGAKTGDRAAETSIIGRAQTVF